jgi:hypothetical protein
MTTTMPLECRKHNTVAAFCECLSRAGAGSADAAAEAFCRRAPEGGPGATGDDLAELKKALEDLESA